MLYINFHSEEIPTVAEPKYSKDDIIQRRRLDELDKQLDSYMPDSLNSSFASSQSNRRDSVDVTSLEIINDDRQ